MDLALMAAEGPGGPAAALDALNKALAICGALAPKEFELHRQVLGQLSRLKREQRKDAEAAAYDRLANALRPPPAAPGEEGYGPRYVPDPITELELTGMPEQRHF